MHGETVSSGARSRIREALLAGLVALAGCAQVHSVATYDAAPQGGDGGGVIAACTAGAAPPPVGTPCAFAGRCPVVFTDFVDGMCGDEGYECSAGRIAEYQNLWFCGSPFPEPDGPCRRTSATPEAFPAEGTESLGTGGVLQACASASGWDQCDGGTVSIDLVGTSGSLATLDLIFDTSDVVPAERICWLRPSDPARDSVPCSFHGVFDLSGQACGGIEPVTRLCGELVVDRDGLAIEASIALQVLDVGLCF